MSQAVPTLKTKLLRKLRFEAYCNIGVFKFSDGKYRIVYDLSYLDNVNRFNESEWKMYKDNYLFKVFNEEDGCDTLEEAKELCDRYRRAYILKRVRQLRGNQHRYY